MDRQRHTNHGARLVSDHIKMLQILAGILSMISTSCSAADFRPDHIVVVVQENHGFSELIDNPNAPFVNRLASQGLVFTNFHGIGRPSQVNYFALFSGSTHGITDDDTHTISEPTLADQLARAGLSFIGYGESGAARKHKPWESFVGSQHCGQDFKFFPGSFDRLPTVAFVTPNLSHNMHDGTVSEGDRWLQRHFERYASWAKRHNSLFVLTFDEDGGHDDNRVLTIVVGARVKAGSDDTPGNQYSLLRAIQSMYGLPPLADSAAEPLKWRTANRHQSKARRGYENQGARLYRNDSARLILPSRSSDDRKR